MPLPAAAQAGRHHKVEAAYLYNFFNYITWPGYASPQDLQEATICYMQDDPIEPYLEYVQQKMAAERNLNLRKVAQRDNVQGCDLLFVRERISRDAEKNLPASTLLVSEPMDSLDRGQGMIELDRIGQTIQMRIDQQALERSGFQVSSRLLDLALK